MKVTLIIDILRVWIIFIPLFFLDNVPINAQKVFDENRSDYENFETHDPLWEEMMYYTIANQLDTAYYESKAIFYIKNIAGDSSTFSQFYENGNPHVIGKDLKAKNKKIISKSGSWTTFFPDGSLKEHIAFRKNQKYGHHYKLNQQGDTVYTKQHFQRITYGFSLGYLHNSFRIYNLENNSSQLTTASSFGFTLGLSMLYDFNQRAKAKAQMFTTLHEHQLVFKDGNTRENITLDYVYLDIPLHYMIMPFSTQKFYILGGSTFSFSLPAREAVNQRGLVIKSFDMSLDIGILYDFNIKFAHLLPELRYSKALINSKKESTSQYFQPVDRIFRDQLSLLFNFF